MSADPSVSQSGDSGKRPFAPVALDENGEPHVICEMCGLDDLDFDGADIDKCRKCGHWRYR